MLVQEWADLWEEGRAEEAAARSRVIAAVDRGSAAGARL